MTWDPRDTGIQEIRGQTTEAPEEHLGTLRQVWGRQVSIFSNR